MTLICAYLDCFYSLAPSADDLTAYSSRIIIEQHWREDFERRIRSWVLPVISLDEYVRPSSDRIYGVDVLPRIRITIGRPR